MKTTRELYDQHQRIFRGMMHRGLRLAKQGDPATGGSEHLTRNWGNDAARAAWDRTWERYRHAATIYRRLSAIAEHRTHGPRFSPLWCDACQRRNTA